MMSHSIYKICNGLHWTNPQPYGQRNLHTSLSTDEIQTTLSQAGWHIDRSPILILDGHIFKMNENWSWYHGRHVLGFRHIFWDEKLECWAFLVVAWWLSNKVLKVFVEFSITLLILYRPVIIEQNTCRLMTFTTPSGLGFATSASSGLVRHTTILSMSTMAA